MPRRVAVAGFTVSPEAAGGLIPLPPRLDGTMLAFAGELLGEDGAPIAGSRQQTKRPVEAIQRADGSVVIGVRLGAFPVSGPATLLERLQDWAGVVSQMHPPLTRLVKEACCLRTQEDHPGLIMVDEPTFHPEGRRSVTPELEAQLRLIYEMTAGDSPDRRSLLFTHAITEEVEERHGLKGRGIDTIQLAHRSNAVWNFDQAVQLIEEALNSVK